MSSTESALIRVVSTNMPKMLGGVGDRHTMLPAAS
jgi:hypothetical protein